MITLEKEQLKEYLIRAFDEGFCGYKDLQEEFVASLLAEIEHASNQAQSPPVVVLGGYDEHGQFISSPEPSNNWGTAALSGAPVNTANPIQISSVGAEYVYSAASGSYASPIGGDGGYVVSSHSDFHYD